MESNNLETQGETSAKKKLKNEDEEEPKLEMEKLPQEIVHQILAKLPLSSMIQFKCVCRAWKAMTRHYYLENTCLILQSLYPSTSKLSFVDFNLSIDDTKTKKIQFPISASSAEFDILSSCNGLLCISDSANDDLYIYNPFTSEYRKLPETIKYLSQYVVYGFGFCQKTKEYKVVKVIHHWPCHHRTRDVQGIDVLVFTLGTGLWRNVEQTPPLLDLWQGKQAILNQRINWLYHLYKPVYTLGIVSFDLEDERVRKVPIPDFLNLKRPKSIVSLKGYLSVVFFNDESGESEIWIMKEYGVIESWVNTHKINMLSYLPRDLRGELSIGFDRSVYKRRSFNQVLCELSNGEILLLHNSKALVAYDPKSGSFKDVVFETMPGPFNIVLHLANLNHIVYLETKLSSFYFVSIIVVC